MRKEIKDEMSKIYNSKEDYEQGIERIDILINNLEDENEKKLLKSQKNFLMRMKEKFNENIDFDNGMFPEYQKGGYFQSKDFKKIEEEVEKRIISLGITNLEDFELAKEELLNNEYGLNWKPFKERFRPDANVRF